MTGQRLIDAYERLKESSGLLSDREQEKSIDSLAALADALEGTGLKKGLRTFFSRSKAAAEKKVGLYLFGGVGRGKTMLMDLFFDAASPAKKRRVHFHQFMAEIHERLHILRHAKPRPLDPIEKLVGEIANEATLLCFDEFHVTNIADAMILSRLFAAMWDRGVITVMTSNWAPDELYLDGLQRDRFLPFVEQLKKRAEWIRLDSGRDYRLQELGNQDFYVLKSESGSESRLDSFWKKLSGNRSPCAMTLPLRGRTLSFARAYQSILWTDFTELCARPLSAIDYLALVERFKVVLLERVPMLTPEKREETKRFMTFIDIAYDTKTSLIVSAEIEPDRLLVDDFYQQEFARTASRLNEMRRASYRIT